MIVFIIILLVLVLLLILALRPAPHAKEAMAPFGSWRYAHRGLYNNEAGIPENSLAAFRLAVEGGYGIELDLHLTTDGQLVVFHDDTLDRICGVSGRVEEHSFDELQQLSLLSTGEKIPLFTEVLKIVAGRIPLIVEVKYQKNYAALCQKMMELLGSYSGMYCVESFHPFVVLWMKKNHPEIARGLLSSRFAPQDSTTGKVSFPMWLSQELLYNFYIQPHFIAYHHEFAPHIAGFRAARALWHVPTVAWTVRSEQQEQTARRLFDIVIFEKYRPLPRVDQNKESSKA